MANDVSTYLHDGMELPFEDWSNKLHSFNDLTSIIQTTHDAAFSSTVKAINRMQTMRNWLIGYYIVEFEQHGKDRAEYGTQLLKKLEEKVNRKGVTRNTFQSARNFYRMYPQIIENFQTNICPTVSCKFQTSGKTIISKLSYSHINEIMKVSDPLARYFYEQECIKCTWSVRELRRQITTNLYLGLASAPILKSFSLCPPFKDTIQPNCRYANRSPSNFLDSRLRTWLTSTTWRMRLSVTCKSSSSNSARASASKPAKNALSLTTSIIIPTSCFITASCIAA